VDADLVGAAGVNAKLEVRIGADCFEDFVVGEGGFTAAVDDHDAGFGRVFHDGLVDGSFFLGWGALDDALVDFLYVAVFEDFGEIFMGFFVFCEDDDAAGLAVEAVDGIDVSEAFFEEGL